MPGSPETSKVFEWAIQDHLAVIELVRAQRPVPERIAAETTRAVLAGNKVLWCGDGDSAADSQRLAAEFIGRFRRDRRCLASTASIQEAHILCGHILRGWIELSVCARKPELDTAAR